MVELLKTWRKARFTLRLYDLHKTDSMGKSILGYEFKDGRRVIFKGDDFHCSPMYSIDGLDTIYCLLGFLSVGKHDTDSEYFAEYTPEQIAWRDSQRREDLSILVWEWEERHSR